MFKNSKILKGIILALAVVLVLGGGVLLKMNVTAEENTVIFYVSENGNNTTGKDAATAYTSIAAATKAANDMKLAPGTEVKLIIVDKVRSEEIKMDGPTALDSQGGKLHFTITSDSAKGTILHHVYNGSGSTSYERIIFSNDITFRNIILCAEVQPYYQNAAPITNPIDYNKLYRTRNIYVGSNTVEFDNCDITTTIPDKSKSMLFYCDAASSSAVEGASNLRLLNGDYSNCTVYTQDQITPLWDLSVYVENASVGTVYATADTDQAASTNAKSITCTFKKATVASYNPQGRGQITITEGITAIFEDTTTLNWVGCMKSKGSDKAASLTGDLTYIFRGDNQINVTSTDSKGKAVIYLTPHGVMNGDLRVIVEGGTFNKRLCTGADTNVTDEQTAVINGNIYNEFKGGTFNQGVACGMGAAGGTVNGTITNNFYDGVTFSGQTCHLSSQGGSCKTVVNNVYGGTFGKIDVYFGGGNGYANMLKNVVDGDLINNIYGGTFDGAVYVGPHSQTVTGGIYNTYMGGTFQGAFIAGGVGVLTPEVHNVFKNGSNGSYATLNGAVYLGSRGRRNDGPDDYNIDRVYNTFEGDVKVNGLLYCADGSQKEIRIKELVVNEFKGGTFADYVYCTTKNASTALTADIINSFYDGAIFNKRLYCGGLEGSCGSITNNFYGGVYHAAVTGGGVNGSCESITNNFAGGVFKGEVYGVIEAVTNKKFTVNGDVINNFSGGTFERMVIGSGTVTSNGLIKNNFSGGTFKDYVYALTKANQTCLMDVVTNIYGGNFEGVFVGGSNKSQGGSVTNNVYGGHFMGILHPELGPLSFVGGDWSNGSGKTVFVANNIYGGTFDNRVYLGGFAGVVGKVNSMIAGGIFNGDRLCASMYNNKSSTNCTEVTLDIRPDESDELLFFGCNYSPFGELDSNNKQTYASYGLENPQKRPKDTIILYGAKKPIYMAGESFLNFDEIRGEVTFIQTENWKDGNVYITVPAAKNLDMVTLLNVDAALTGSATVKAQSVVLENAGQNISCTVLVGAANATAPEAVVSPTLAGIKFVLDNNLQIEFYLDKTVLESYLANVGSFTYKITCGEDIIARGAITSIDEEEVVGNYVKIKADFSVAAFDYSKTLTLDFASNLVDYTIYDFLRGGIDNTVDNKALSDLLKAIYNYGVEAEILRYGSSNIATYDGINYTGVYNGKASATSADAGYKFYATSLSIGKEVSLNYYLQAASVDDLDITAVSASGALDVSRIVVTPFAGNSRYNVVISLRLDIGSMEEEFTLSVKNASGTELATCTNSVANSCASYIANNSEFASISKALLAYIEKALAI